MKDAGNLLDVETPLYVIIPWSGVILMILGRYIMLRYNGQDKRKASNKKDGDKKHEKHNEKKETPGKEEKSTLSE
jgi:hypothetical protein